MENKIWGYARCSTNEKKQDIQRQVRELKEMGATDSTIYLEYESGIKEDRQELQKLLASVNDGDTIVATEPSRITRSTKQLIDIIELVRSKSLKLKLGGFTVDCTNDTMDPVTEALLKVIGVFNELERNMICARVKSGISNARAKGVVLGRPTTTYDDIPKIFMQYYPKYKSGVYNKSEFARVTKLSYPTIFKYLGIVENA